MGVTAQRGDGQFATPASVVSGVSAEPDQGVDTSGSEAPEIMGNDISKPISTLQGLPEIPFIEIDHVPVERVNKLPTQENVNKPKSPETDKPEQEVKKMSELSQLQSPYLVKRVTELENMEKPVFENSAECETVREKCVICDEASPANETVEEESVTASDTGLARKGSVASCEEYSSGEGVPVGTGIEAKMYGVTQGGALSCGEVYGRIKSSSEGDVYSLKNCERLKDNEPCTDDQVDESGESSEGELSESEQSESDNIIKNDSGCWDQRESSVNLNENESQAGQATSLYSGSGIIDKSKGKKRVKWADIDGKSKLTQEREGSIISSEESSEEEESDDEEPEKEKDDEEDESEEEDDSEEEEEDSNNLIKVKIIDKTVKDNNAESESSSEEESEEEGITSFNEVIEQPETTEIHKEDSEESEEESSAEESGNEDE